MSYDTDQIKKQKEDFDRSQRELSAKQHEEAVRNFRNNGNNNGCFVASTRISTDRGTMPICDISPGQRVVALDKGSGSTCVARVKANNSYANVRIVELKTATGSVETTRDHPFLAKKGWKKAGKLSAGEAILDVDGNYVDIVSVTVSDRYEQTFNLIVENHYNYIANGFVVNSFGSFRTVRSLCCRTLDTISRAGIRRAEFLQT